MRTYPRFAALEPLESRRLLSAGDLDLSFSDDGRNVIDLPGVTNESANAAVVQSDGKILLAGRATVGGELDFLVVRLLATGNLDMTFGGGDGFITIDFQVNDEAMDLAIDSSNRIVIVGTSSSGAGSNARQFAVARLTSTGGLDASFSGDGKTTVDFGINADAQAVAIAGSLIYVGGYKDLGATGQFALARLLSNGSPDTTYSGDGEVFFGFGGNNDSRCYDITVDSLGRVIMVGYDENLSSSATGRNFAYAMVGTNAVVDPTFSGDGLAVTDFATGDDEARAVTLDAIGRLVVAGTAEGTNRDFAVTRLTLTGSLDSSFSGDGRFTVDLGGVDTCEGLVVAPDLTIRLSGMTSAGSFQAAVVQIRQNTGTLDTTFGDGADGIQMIDFGGIDAGFAIAMDPRDKSTVVGGTDGSGRLAVGRLVDLVDRNFATPPEMELRYIPADDGQMYFFDDGILRRVHSDGTIDPTFLPFDADSDGVSVNRTMNLDDQNRPIVVSTKTNISGVRVIRARRLNLDGTTDTAWGVNGIRTFSFGSFTVDSTLKDVRVDAAGRLVVFGTVGDDSATNEYGIARLTTSGALDATFSGDGRLVDNHSAAELNLLQFEVDAFNRALVSTEELTVTLHRFTRISRYTAAGVLDTTFSGNGRHDFEPASGIESHFVFDLETDNSGRIILVGHFTQNAGDKYAPFVARLTNSGDVDATWNGGNLLTFRLLSNAFEAANDIFIDSAGDYWVTSSVAPSVTNLYSHGLIHKFNPDGTRATEFSSDGAYVRANDTPFLNPILLIKVEGAVVYFDNADRKYVRLNVAPEAVGTDLRFETLPQRLQVRFNDNVGDSLASTDLVIRNVTTNVQLNPANHPLAGYDALTNTATVNFNGILADGNYTVTFSNTGITNRQNMQLAGDRVHNFFFLNGDANRDRIVDIGDFAILAGRFNQPGTFSQGNFDYTGNVDIGDFAILATQFNKSLPATGDLPRGGAPAAIRLAPPAASPPLAGERIEDRPAALLL